MPFDPYSKLGEIASRITTRTSLAALALILLHVSLYFVKGIPDEAKPWLLSGTLIAAVLMLVIIGPSDVQKANNSSEFEIEVIEDRAEMYLRCQKAIDTAKKSVTDTTWGRDAKKRSVAEKSALESYLNAQRRAVARGIEYRELFTPTDKRIARLETAIENGRVETNYDVRVLHDFQCKIPMIDFMVIDRKEVIFSTVQATTGEKRRYIFIRCEKIANLYADHFDECWSIAKEDHLKNDMAID
jgi:hypothetical protein